MRALRTVAYEVWATLLATLREIFDESAYERFLTRNAVRSSRAAWAAFVREQACGRERRARCC